jgi:YHS domain-containing protein
MIAEIVPDPLPDGDLIGSKKNVHDGLAKHFPSYFSPRPESSGWQEKRVPRMKGWNEAHRQAGFDDAPATAPPPIDRTAGIIYSRFMLGGLFRLVFWVFVAYLAYLVFRLYRAATRRRVPPREPRRIQGVMVKDDVCNTYIPKEEAIREVRGGEERFFCSEECRRKSRQD